MKQCMDYTVEKAGKEKKIEFGFTTNLTLVTREMAEYFASLDFCAITGSLDGPEEVHDAYRVFAFCRNIQPAVSWITTPVLSQKWNRDF